VGWTTFEAWTEPEIRERIRQIDRDMAGRCPFTDRATRLNLERCALVKLLRELEEKGKP
jgi:hypothetical protein